MTTTVRLNVCLWSGISTWWKAYGRIGLWRVSCAKTGCTTQPSTAPVSTISLFLEFIYTMQSFQRRFNIWLLSFRASDDTYSTHVSPSHTPILKRCDDALWAAEPAEDTCGVQHVVPSVAPGCLHPVSTPLLTEDESSKQRGSEKGQKYWNTGTTRRKPKILRRSFSSSLICFLFHHQVFQRVSHYRILRITLVPEYKNI